MPSREDRRTVAELHTTSSSVVLEAKESLGLTDRFMGNLIIRILLYCAGGIGVVAVFFFGTLYVLSSSEIKSRDAIRIGHAKLLKDALDRYQAARGKFPAPFPDNPVEDLKPALVDGGFLKAIPSDPLPTQTYRYTTGSLGGVRYGLRITLEETGNCVTGVNVEGTGWWAPAPACPF